MWVRRIAEAATADHLFAAGIWISAVMALCILVFVIYYAMLCCCLGVYTLELRRKYRQTATRFNRLIHRSSIRLMHASPKRFPFLSTVETFHPARRSSTEEKTCAQVESQQAYRTQLRSPCATNHISIIPSTFKML